MDWSIEGVDDAVRAIVAWLDDHNGRNDMEISSRILKIGEEFGEAANAWIGALGQNPRKKYYATDDDVVNELADVAITALVAIHSLNRVPSLSLFRRIESVVDRIETEKGERDGY